MIVIIGAIGFLILVCGVYAALMVAWMIDSDQRQGRRAKKGS
jgi:hypothetical protein